MGVSGSKIVKYIEKLELKVGLLQCFDCSLQGYARPLEALQDDIGEIIDELHQLVQSQSADLQFLDVDISQDSSSIESPRMEQTVSGGYDSALEYLQDFLESGRKIECIRVHPFKSKPNLAAGAAEQANSMSHSSQLETASHEMSDALKLDFSIGGTEQTATMSGYSLLENSHEMLGTKKPDFAVGDTEESALEAYLTTLETVGDQVFGQLQEQSAHSRDLCQGSIVATPGNSLKTSVRCWVGYVTILEHSRQRTKKRRHWRKFRLSAVWASKNCRSGKLLSIHRGDFCKQLKVLISGLDQRTRRKEGLQEHIVLLDTVAINLLATNKDFVGQMHEKIIHVTTSTATELQELNPEVQTLTMSLQEQHTAARDCIVPYTMATALEEPPACIDIKKNYEAAILQEFLYCLKNIRRDEGNADLKELISKVAMAEEVVITATKCILERSPASALKEVFRRLSVIVSEPQVRFMFEVEIEGRSFEEWLPEILPRINGRRKH